MKTNEPKVPDGFRPLHDGELIRPGDIFLPNDHTKGWQPVYDAENDDVQRIYDHRRFKPHARKVTQ